MKVGAPGVQDGFLQAQGAPEIVGTTPTTIPSASENLAPIIRSAPSSILQCRSSSRGSPQTSPCNPADTGLGSPRITSMAGGRAATLLDLAQTQRERNRRQRQQHQHPEGVHVGEERCLQLHLLSDPREGLLLRLD
jgi:hypothetical protein